MITISTNNIQPLKNHLIEEETVLKSTTCFNVLQLITKEKPLSIFCCWESQNESELYLCAIDEGIVETVKPNVLVAT